MSTVVRPDGSGKPISPSSSTTPISQVASKVMGSIAHDLRTPIMVVRGYLKMMLDGRIGSVTDEQAVCLKGLLGDVARL